MVVLPAPPGIRRSHRRGARGTRPAGCARRSGSCARPTGARRLFTRGINLGRAAGAGSGRTSSTSTSCRGMLRPEWTDPPGAEEPALPVEEVFRRLGASLRRGGDFRTLISEGPTAGGSAAGDRGSGQDERERGGDATGPHAPQSCRGFHVESDLMTARRHFDAHQSMIHAMDRRRRPSTVAVQPGGKAISLNTTKASRSASTRSRSEPGPAPRQGHARGSVVGARRSLAGVDQRRLTRTEAIAFEAPGERTEVGNRLGPSGPPRRAGASRARGRRKPSPW